MQARARYGDKAWWCVELVFNHRCRHPVEEANFADHSNNDNVNNAEDDDNGDKGNATAEDLEVGTLRWCTFTIEWRWMPTKIDTASLLMSNKNWECVLLSLLSSLLLLWGACHGARPCRRWRI